MKRLDMREMFSCPYGRNRDGMRFLVAKVKISE